MIVIFIILSVFSFVTLANLYIGESTQVKCLNDNCIYDIITTNIETNYPTISLFSYDNDDSYSQVYAVVSGDNSSPSIKDSIYKTQLTPNNKIIIPKSYYNSYKQLYLSLHTTQTLSIIIQVLGVDRIPLDSNELIQFISDKPYETFTFVYNNNVGFTNIDTFSVKVYSSSITCFNISNSEIKSEFNNPKITFNQFWRNGYEAQINVQYIKNTTYEIVFEIIVLKQYQVISLDIESKTYPIASNKIIKFETNKHYYRVFSELEEHCYELNNVDNELYTLDFYINPEFQITFSYGNITYVINYSKSIYFETHPNTNNYFCINKTGRTTISHYIGYHFIGYRNKNIELSQPYLSSIIPLNVIERTIQKDNIIYYRMEYPLNDNEDIYCNINLLEGNANVYGSLCKEFPLCEYNINNINDISKQETITPIIISDRNYFFKYSNSNNELIESNNSKQYVFIIHCLSTTCTYTVLFYTNIQNFKIQPLPNKNVNILSNDKHGINPSINFVYTDRDIYRIHLSLFSYLNIIYSGFDEEITTHNVNQFQLGNSYYRELNNDSKSSSYNPLMTDFNFMFNLNYNNDYITLSINNDNDFHIWMNEIIVVPIHDEVNIKLTEKCLNKHSLILHLIYNSCAISLNNSYAWDQIFKSVDDNMNMLYLSPYNEKDMYNLQLVNKSNRKCYVTINAFCVNDNNIFVNTENILLHDNQIHYDIIQGDNRRNRVLPLKKKYDFLLFDNTRPIAIVISFEGSYTLNVEISHGNPNEKIIKEIDIYFSRVIILSPSDLPSTPTKPIVLKVTITTQDDEILYSINIKTFQTNTPTLLPHNTQIVDIIQDDYIQQFETLITKETNYIVGFTSKKGSGYIYAELKLSSTDKAIQSYYADITTNQFEITPNDTVLCDDDNNNICTLYIYIQSNDVNINPNTHMHIYYEYSIYLSSNTDNSQNIQPIAIKSNEYIQGVLKQANQHVVVYQYKILPGTNELRYEIKCDSCIVGVKINNSPGLININGIYKEYLSSANTNKVKLYHDFPYYYHNYLIFSITCTSLDDIFFTSFLFKIIPSYNNQFYPFELITSEIHSYCDIFVTPICRQIMPVYPHNSLSEIIVSVSSQMEKRMNKISMNIYLYKMKEYLRIIKGNEEHITPVFGMSCSNAQQGSNYGFVTNKAFSTDELIMVMSFNVTMQESQNQFEIHFTYIKHNLQGVNFIPKISNLLVLRSGEINKMNYPPQGLLDTRNQQVNPFVICVRHIKGGGVIHYDNSNSNTTYINKANKNTNIVFLGNKQFSTSIESINSVMFYYMTLKISPFENLNEVKLNEIANIILYSKPYPIMLYLRFNPSIMHINEEITFNLHFTNLPKNIKWSIKGYILTEKALISRMNDNKLLPNINSTIPSISNTFTHNTVIKFNITSIHSNNYIPHILLIRIQNENETSIKYKDNSIPIVKCFPFQTKSASVPIPNYNYIHSYIEHNSHIYKLDKSYHYDNAFIIEITLDVCLTYEIFDNHNKTTSFESNLIYSNHGTSKLLISLSNEIPYLYIKLLPLTTSSTCVNADYIKNKHYIIKSNSLQLLRNKPFQLYYNNITLFSTTNKNIMHLQWNVTPSSTSPFNTEGSKYYVLVYKNTQHSFMMFNPLIAFYNGNGVVYGVSTNETFVNVDKNIFGNENIIICVYGVVIDNENEGEEYIDVFECMNVNKRMFAIIVDGMLGIGIGIITLIMLIIIVLYMYRLIRVYQTKRKYVLLKESKDNNNKSKRTISKEQAKLAISYAIEET